MKDGKWRAWIRKLKPDWLTLVLLGLIVYVWFRPPAWVSGENRTAPDIQATLLDGRETGLIQLPTSFIIGILAVSRS
ncbi:MAG: hypothetical protein ACYCTW_05630 [Sulfuricella sp.]